MFGRDRLNNEGNYIMKPHD